MVVNIWRTVLKLWLVMLLCMFVDASIIACTNIGLRQVFHCDLNSYEEKVPCTPEGKCNCKPHKFGNSCEFNSCTYYYESLPGGQYQNNPGRHCGNYGKCLLNSTDLNLVCNCTKGWKDLNSIGQDGRGDGTRCRVQDPCLVNDHACNLANCPGCKCEQFGNLEEFKENTVMYTRLGVDTYFRSTYQCICDTDFYLGRNSSHLDRPTCYKRQCRVNNPNVKTCTELDGKAPLNECNKGYSGIDCEITEFCEIRNYQDNCSRVDPRARCPAPIREEKDLRCVCGTPGYNGQHCDIIDYCVVDYLSSVFCGRHGKCDKEKSSATSEVCICDDGYIGERCVRDGCESYRPKQDLCVHAINKTCIGNLTVSNQFSCGGSTELAPLCIEGWSGARCDIENRCITEQLCNSGIGNCENCCVLMEPKTTRTNRTNANFLYYYYECHCSPEYSLSPQCQIYDKCYQPRLDRACNDGACIFDENDPSIPYSCVCSPGFFGTTCERTDFCFKAIADGDDPCNTNLNPGNICKRQEIFQRDRIKCICAAGFRFNSFTDEKCVNDPCYQVTCENLGDPIYTSPDNCTCSCRFGFHGDRCEYNDLCAQDTSNRLCNSFPCTAQKNGFTCDCPQDRYTATCQVKDMCRINPFVCDDVATISTNPSGGQANPINKCVSKSVPGQYACECAEGWTAEAGTSIPNCFEKDLCTDPVTKCNSEGHVKCSYTSLSTKPVCECKEYEFYYGDKCEFQDTCSSVFRMPYCVQNGTKGCNPVNKTVATCECKNNFYGTKCEYIDTCTKINPCHNGGKCERVANNYKCECPRTHLGRNCELQNGCVRDNPCRNNFPCNSKPNASGKNDWSCSCGEEFQRKLDCSERDPCVKTNNCKHGGRCQRVDNNKILCDCTGLNYVGTRCQHQKSQIFLDYPQNAIVGRAERFILIVKRTGDEPSFKIDFDDTFTFEISETNLIPLNPGTIQDQRGILEQEGISALTPHANKNWFFFPFVHIFRRGRTFYIWTNVSNGEVSTENFLNKVNVASIYCLPVVTLQNCGHTREQRQDSRVPLFERKHRFVIESSLYYEGCQPTGDIRFKWTLFRLTAEAPYPRIDNEWALSGITAHENDDLKHIIFLPYNLLEGEYWIQLFVYYEHEEADATKRPIGNLDWCYFNLQNSQPIARIDGGNARTINYHATGNAPIVFNASSSIDQNDPTNPKLTYDWSYRVNGQTFSCSELSKSSCSATWIEVDVRDLDRATEYIFHVDVQSNRANEKMFTSIATQRINIIEEGIEIVAQCVENCLRLNPNDTVHIECSCEDCGTSHVIYSYTWDEAFGKVSVSGSNNQTYQVELGVDPSGSRHEFTCIGAVVMDDGILHSGSSSFSITINKPPDYGICSQILVPNTNGGLLEFLKQDPYHISLTCSGFKDIQLPLSYEIFAKVVGTVDPLLPDGILLFHDVFEEFLIYFFPMGQLSTNYTVGLDVWVSDSYALPTETPLTLPIMVFPPLLSDSYNIDQDYIRNIQAAFRTRIDKNFGFQSEVGSDLTLLIEAGDYQKALQLILSVLYTQKVYNKTEYDTISNLTMVEQQTVWDRIMVAIRRVPLHSFLIVKQVIHSVYLLSYYAPFLTNGTLLGCAEQLILSAKYFRNFVIQNEEVIYIGDIYELANSGKYAAENIMTVTESRGRELIEKQELRSRNQHQLQLQHLYQQDRDYFLDVDELTATNRNTSIEIDDLDDSELDTITRMSTICQEAFISMIHILELIASREVLGTTKVINWTMTNSSQVKTSVEILNVNEITQRRESGIQFPPEIATLITKQNAQTIQIHNRESRINPYFGDLDTIVATSIVSVQIKSDDVSSKGADQWIRLKETTEPITIRIPFLTKYREPGVNALNDTSQANIVEQAVELVPFDEISDLNPNIPMYHLNLIHGSSFNMTVVTKSEPLEDFAWIEYQAALVKDYRPTTEEFCRQRSSHTRRFLSGQTVEFRIEDVQDGSDDVSDYLDYYVGIWPFGFNESGSFEFGTKLNFSVQFSQLSCLTRNEDENKWTGSGCEVSNFVESEYLECKCNHLSIFAGSVLIPPNKIDIINDFDLFLTIPENWIVTAAVCTLLGLWIILHLICYWKDRKDRLHHVGITVMCEIGENFSHTFYLVRVVTGSRISAGTTSNVSIQIYGSNGRSKVYVIKDPTLSVLNRGGNDSFLISSVKELGELEKIRVWHDNSGSRPGWYLWKIIIRNVKTGQRWYFFADTWLSMTYEVDPTVIREVPVATQAELHSFNRRFSDRLVEEFNNSHLWFSMLFRLPSSNFTRCQRLACSMGILSSFMLINIIWEGVPTADHSSMFEVGDFDVNLGQFLLALQITIVATPIGVILILLFRRIRKRRIPTLVVLKDRVKRQANLINYNEGYVFLPDDNGEFNRKVIPMGGGGDIDGEKPLPFSIPETDMTATESWIKTDTRGHGLRPYSLREPDAFVHKVTNPDEEAEHLTSASHLLRIGRRAIALSVRQSHRDSFIYSGDGDFETQFDAEIRARAEMKHPWTKLKKAEIRALEEEVKSELPKLLPLEVVDKDNMTEDVVYHGVSLDLYLMSPVYKKKGYLRWWFIYVSWVLTVLTVLICSFFTIFYGLSIGRLRSKHWLSEICFAFVQTVIITQPIRIVVVAFVLSLIYRKIHATEEDRFQVIVHDGTENLETYRKLQIAQFQPFRSYPPLSGPELLKLRLKARRRNELKRGMVALFFHLLSMVFLASIISNSSSDKFSVTSHLKNMLQLNDRNHKLSNFSNIETTNEFYQYMVYFASATNPLRYYNGITVDSMVDARYESTMMSDSETMIIGVPRLRQVRISPSECAIHANVKRFYLNSKSTLSSDQQKQKSVINCTLGYSSLQEDTQTYNPFWKDVIGKSRSWKSTNDVWTWKTPNDTQSIKLTGKVATYDAGGYVAELGLQNRKTVAVLNYLRQTKWIDSQTRAVFVEMSVMVPNVNMFADVLLILERSPAGAFASSARILPFQITFPPKGEIMRTWATICYFGISIYTGGLIFVLGRGIVTNWLHYRIGFIGNLWLWLDFFIAVSSMLSLGLAMKFKITREKIHERFDKSLVNEFINLQKIAFWDYMHISAFAGVFGLCILKSWRFLILLLDRFYILALTLRLSARFLIGFILLIVILVMAFACWGVLAFGQTLEQFHSVSHAFLELKHQLLQAKFYNELKNVHSVVGPIYYLFFGLTLVLVSVNLFVALLSSGFFEAKEIAKQRRHRETYWTVIKNSRLSHFFCRTNPPKNTERKLPIPPLRIQAMEQATAKFIRACVETDEFLKMKQMLKFCNEDLLKGTGYSMVSKKDKKKRIRDSMNTTLSISNQRLESMRQLTIRLLHKRLRLHLTPEEAREYTKFHMTILQLKIKKVEKVLRRMNEVIDKFMEYLNEEEQAALDSKLRAEAQQLKQSAMGWRRYLPPEVLLNTSGSQKRYEAETFHLNESENSNDSAA